MRARDRRHPFSFPLRIDHRGSTAQVDLDGHVRDLIEQLMFTSPGERVNRPSFGTDLRHAVFSPNSNELATALEHMVRGSLQRWLGDELVVEDVTVGAEEALLRIEVRYQVKREARLRVARFERPLG